MSSYFIPKDSIIGQEEVGIIDPFKKKVLAGDYIDRILADSEDLLANEDNQDDLDFLDVVDTGMSSDQTRELREILGQSSSVNSNPSRRTGQQELEHVTRDLEETLSKFLQTHQPPCSAYATEDPITSAKTTGLRTGTPGTQSYQTEQDRAFGEQLDRFASVSLAPAFTENDEASKLIMQAKETATLEAKYGTRDEAQLASLTSRHDELKKGVQGLSSVRDALAAKRDNDAELGPPPAAIDLTELRSGGKDGGSTKGSARSIKSVQSSTSTSSARSGSNVSTRTKSTTKSKSSTTSSIPKSAQWKAAVDPLGMSSKAVGPGFMPMFSTSLYSPGFQVPNAASGGGTAGGAGPKAFQSKQLKFVEKKKSDGIKSSAASAKSGKSGLSSKTTKTVESAKSTRSVESSGSSSSTKSSFFSALKESFQSPTEPPPLQADQNRSPVQAEKQGSTPKEVKIDAKDSTDRTTQPSDIEAAQPLFPSVPASMPTLTITADKPSTPQSPVHDLTAHASMESIIGSRKPSWTPPLPATARMPSSAKELLRKRIVSWEYLGRVYNGQLAYYNTIVLTESDLRKHFAYETVQKRTLPLFLLGNSIAQLLDVPHLPDFVKALSVVLNEYEHFLSSSGSRSKMNFFGRRASDGRPFEESGEYAHFEVKTVPFEMDYTIVFTTLCEVIAEAYSKFDTQDPASLSHWTDHDLFQKIESRLKKISNTAYKDLDSLTREVMQEELDMLDPIGNLLVDWDQQVLALGGH
ncbi:hypothetical protein BGZ83_000052 [Gryganskiella cystojenkinii]|nr:hypothetical protein BGZ83_000052 [Gryganskiella cystojenkinii]